MPSRSELRKQFCSITGASSDVATTYLDKFHWNINSAVDAYLNQNHDYTPNTLAAPSQALVDLFDRYKDPEDNTTISIEGTLAYLEDLNIDPEDPRSLTLSYLLKSPQTGEFPQSQFLDFWTTNHIDSIPAMKRFIDKSHVDIMDSPSKYEDFYQYCFEFIRGSDVRIKSITHEDAISYWGLLFAARSDLESSSERLTQWYEFVASSNKSITRDTWVMFYKFLLEVINTDPISLSGYDEMSSWPSMVDEFIEWLYENGHLEEN